MCAHVPVLLRESVDGLDPKPGAVILDATLGGGGHASAIAERIMPGGRLIGIDKDEDAIKRCTERLSGYAGRADLLHGDFVNAAQMLEEIGVQKVNGILADLGVSSFQLDEAERGFSYHSEAPLDMRMDRSAKLCAYDVVNGYDAQQLAQVISRYGEEKWAARIADFIVRQRAKAPVKTTTELADLIKQAVPAGARRTGPHPARRTFQALRIEVNGELTNLRAAIEGFCDLLAPGGRLCVITFHSLEDRIVKQVIARREDPCTCPPDSPVCVCGRKPTMRRITRKPIVPAQSETEENPRARSAKLRIAERI